jgi:hypothetical protein
MNSAGGTAGIPIGSFTLPAVNGQHNRVNMFLLGGANDLGTYDSTYIRSALVPIRLIPASTCGIHFLTTNSLQVPFLQRPCSMRKRCFPRHLLREYQEATLITTSRLAKATIATSTAWTRRSAGAVTSFGRASVFNIPYTSQTGVRVPPRQMRFLTRIYFGRLPVRNRHRCGRSRVAAWKHFSDTIPLILDTGSCMGTTNSIGTYHSSLISRSLAP